ncbi:phasin family protein [Beggiatoa alba B18LD]|uniref:Phasin family protein n=1 Tax=Beggiatoa alba B18LD TaxID=395493 RepID=I3CJM0_9GAMM|nr:phasin family protein [Beggiatoa alba]EIJ43813.1 phasin family protein [Beggiatoa alba B18LD]
MDNELLKKWTDMNKVAMDAMKELGEINTTAMTRLTQRQMEMVNLYMESGSKQLQAMSDVKNVQDLVNVQSRLFAEMNEKLMENARQTIEILVDVKSELAGWAEKGMDVVNSNLPKSVKK